MSRRTRKARSGGPLPSRATLTWAYRADVKRVPELVDTERMVGETALLSELLFKPDVPTITTASRWIEILTVVLREALTSQDAIYHALEEVVTLDDLA